MQACGKAVVGRLGIFYRACLIQADFDTVFWKAAAFFMGRVDDDIDYLCEIGFWVVNEATVHLNIIGRFIC